jgi:hypothetical protein
MAEAVAAGVREAGVNANRVHSSRTHVSYPARCVAFQRPNPRTTTYDTALPPVHRSYTCDGKGAERAVGLSALRWSGGATKAARLRRSKPLADRPVASAFRRHGRRLDNSANSAATSPRPCADRCGFRNAFPRRQSCSSKQSFGFCRRPRGWVPPCAGRGDEELRAYSIDFNWGAGTNDYIQPGTCNFAKPGLWADANPAAHVDWYAALGCNVIQSFAVSCNGYAWYKNGVVPPQPGLKYDFLTEEVKLAHQKRMLVIGYFCAGSNTKWGREHPSLL